MAEDGMDGVRASVALTATITLEASPERVFPLLTPEGERLWVEGWAPRYPASTRPEESAGATFLTSNHGQEAVWVIAAKDDARCRARYVCVIPGGRASLVSVACTETATGATAATISYSVTALSPDWDTRVLDLEAAYPSMMEEWTAALHRALSATPSA